MSEYTCAHPFGKEHAAMYREPTEHNERGWMPVCKQHVDPTKDGVERL